MIRTAGFWCESDAVLGLPKLGQNCNCLILLYFENFVNRMERFVQARFWGAFWPAPPFAVS